ncbi:MAG: deoxyribodipyrimidine photo-lyase [Bacteroidetes bacterium]|nr:deoxyribodipyrimidine photo-lyase [Bacteroidota bacterium]
MKKLVIFWFRRDLRLDDNAGLYHALKSGYPVLPVFIFDRKILDRLENRNDRRVEFIHAALVEMQGELEERGASLEVHYGLPLDVFRRLTDSYLIMGVYTNTDYEPYATERDLAVGRLLQERGIPFYNYKDQVIFEKGEVLKDDGKPYTIFTPYSRKWKSTLSDFYLSSYPTKKYWRHFLEHRRGAIPSLASMGFSGSGEPFSPAVVRADLLRDYEKTRDLPGVAGTSRMGVHLRMGTVSIRALARKAGELSETYLNELIWREFYQMILWHFPAVGQGRSFRPVYDHVRWRNNEKEFERWCAGQTGYPIVDAGMRELNATGFMHNRVRMIVASFLAKHLLIDWRWGEAYFAERLLDFELASNNGNWQWAAGCGCDAAPYFRVFNPTTQTRRFDPGLSYIRKWVPEWQEPGYPRPMVDHDEARKRALEAYSKAVKRE